MIQEMSVPAEVLQRIDALAAKVGATAEHLWPALVKYEFWESFGDLFVVPVPAAVAYFLFRLSRASKNCDTKVPLGIAASVMMLISFGCLCLVPSTIATLASPEAAALKSLLGDE